MTESLTVLMAQINPIVGAIDYNTNKIIQIISTHQNTHDIIIFPELAICGYPPEDLLFRPDLHHRVENALQTIIKATLNCHIVLGHPQIVNKLCYNTASIIYQHRIIAQYHKQQLPNYGVFDEKRYFMPGESTQCILSIKNYQVGLCICEDLWVSPTIEKMMDKPIDLLIAINASPFDHTKHTSRIDLVKPYAQQGTNVIYVNMIGGQDELVFDGQSFAMNKQGVVKAQAPAFVETCHSVTMTPQEITGNMAPASDNIALIYQALVTGLRDYCDKNNMPGVLLGLSGGVDSALTLAIAVDALGPKRVTAMLLPSRYSAEISTIDALEQVNILNVNFLNISIENSFKTLLATLQPVMPNEHLGITAENLQARIRGILLMALSNQTGNMLLSTTNKSEAAVGYGTLYGDMCGGYAVLKDVFKTMVYELARYRNRRDKVIPDRVLTRPPSAELAPNQTDQDTLPDYATLDDIIQDHMEQRLDRDQLIAKGYPVDDVEQTLSLIKRNEYKRHQAPPGTKISLCAFGRDWRFPITNRFEITQPVSLPNAKPK